LFVVSQYGHLVKKHIERATTDRFKQLCYKAPVWAFSQQEAWPAATTKYNCSTTVLGIVIVVVLSVCLFSDSE